MVSFFFIVDNPGMFEPKPTYGESTTHANSAIFREPTGRDDRTICL